MRDTDSGARQHERRALLRGGALSFVGSAGSAALGFLVVLASAQLMGDAGAGVLLQLIGLFSIVTVLAKVGLDSAALWLLPRLAHYEPSAVRRHVTFILCVAALTGGVAALCTSLGLSRVLALNAEQQEVATAAAALSWFVPAGVLVLVTMGITRALGALVPFVLYGNVGLPALRLVAVIVAAGLGASSTVVSISWAAALVPVLAVLLWVTIRQLRPFRADHDGGSEPEAAPRWPVRSERRSILGFALPRTASSGLEQLLIWLDVLIVGAMLGPAAAGLYGAATRFIAAGLIVDAALRIVISPRFSVLLHAHDLSATQSLYRTATRWLVLFATPGFVLLAMFAPVPLSWLGQDFAAAAPALITLSLGAMVTFLAGNIHSILLMSGHAGWAATNKAAAVLVSVLGCVTLIPALGLLGAAVAWASAMMVDAVMATIEVRLLVGVSPELVAGLSSLGLSVAAVGIPAAFVRLALGATNASLLLGTTVGGATFFLLVYLMRHRLELSGLKSAA